LRALSLKERKEQQSVDWYIRQIEDRVLPGLHSAKAVQLKPGDFELDVRTGQHRIRRDAR